MTAELSSCISRLKAYWVVEDAGIWNSVPALCLEFQDA